MKKLYILLALGIILGSGSLSAMINNTDGGSDIPLNDPRRGSTSTTKKTSYKTWYKMQKINPFKLGVLKGIVTAAGLTSFFSWGTYYFTKTDGGSYFKLHPIAYLSIPAAVLFGITLGQSRQSKPKRNLSFDIKERLLPQTGEKKGYIIGAMSTLLLLLGGSSLEEKI